jgi:hypothetical protein
MMKRRLLVFSISMGLLGFFILAGSFPPDDMKARINEASRIFFGPPDASVTSARILKSILELLDITASLTPESQYKADIQYRINVAKELFQKESMFNEKGRQYLFFAYRQMTNGEKYERPKELDEFVTPAEAQEKSRKYGRGLVDSALAAIDAGKPGEAARLLLELVLMIVTPISG